MSELGLEQRLVELGREIEWPQTPRFELGAERRPVRRRLRPLAIGLAVAVVAFGAVLAVSPGARSALLELFHLKGATIELVETLPEVPVQEPDFGERVSRDEAERRVGFELVGLEGQEPDAVYVLDDRLATLVYGPVDEPRLVLSQLNGSVWDGFVKKVGAGGTRVEPVQVDGEPGFFVTGDDHFVMFRDESGSITDERTFLAGTVLLWNRAGRLLRLEGDLTKSEALELAGRAE
ncbi:MAG TPA: hypothetical protein VIA10_12825 [Gaiellaceae bacterium]|jgi:hypothetical protein